MSSKNIVFVGANDDLKTVLACFQVNKISHAPVIEEGRFIGLISKTDVTNKLYDLCKHDPNQSFSEVMGQVLAKELMTQPVITSELRDSEDSILEKLLSHDIGSVVVKDGQSVAGIVTEKDVVRYLYHQRENSSSFSDRLANHIVQWMDDHGVFKVTKMLGDVGI